MGHVLQGRFKAVLVEKESHLLELARYVVLNPVRARMVRSARDWPWSSYRATTGQSEVPEFLTVEWILSQSHGDAASAVREYRRFVKQGRGLNIWDELRNGILLGSEGFVEKLKPLLADQAALKEILRRERLAIRPSLAELFADVPDKQARNQ